MASVIHELYGIFKSAIFRLRGYICDRRGPLMDDLTNYMRTRRSALSMTLEEPGPTGEQVLAMVEIASRVPDHGKLAPWRFVQWDMPVRRTMHGQLIDLLHANPDIPDQPKKEQGTNKLLHAPCVIAVISKAGDHPKIPEWEQILSTGAVCMNLLIAANAQGFEAQWLTAWYVYRDDARDILGLEEGERLAGIIHIGSSTIAKNERPRPDIDSIFSIRKD